MLQYQRSVQNSKKLQFTKKKKNIFNRITCKSEINIGWLDQSMSLNAENASLVDRLTLTLFTDLRHEPGKQIQQWRECKQREPLSTSCNMGNEILARVKSAIGLANLQHRQRAVVINWVEIGIFNIFTKAYSQCSQLLRKRKTKFGAERKELSMKKWE